MAPRLHSTRRRQWYVKPVEVVGSVQGGVDQDKILCGYLFNAAVERKLDGNVVGEGEQCCIALEPIADARLEFSQSLCVHNGNPALTGVQLTCGHRFSAVYLLWYWCTSPMSCPMCRTEFSNRSRGLARASIENFPVASWRLLRGLVRAHEREQEEEELGQLRVLNAHDIVDDVVDVVFGDGDAFILMLSLETCPGDAHVVEYLPLHRTSGDFQALHDDVFSFCVQRASLRHFTRILDQFSRTTDVTVQHARILRSTVLMRVSGDETNSLHIPIVQIAQIDLPMLNTRMSVATSTEIIPEVVSDMHTTVGGLDTHTTLSRTGSMDTTTPTTLNIDTITIVDTTTPNLDPLNPVDVGVDPVRVQQQSTLVPMYRDLNISAPCIDLNGMLDLEVCQNNFTGGVNSLIRATLSMKASQLLREVARWLTPDQPGSGD